MSAPSAPIIRAWPICATTSINFIWTAPASGAPLEKYTLACSAISYSQDVSGDLLTYTVTGLTAGTEYDFTITATNATGTGPAAAFPRVAAGVRPFGPSEATASTIDTTTALVTWTPSTIADEAPTRWYILTAQPSTAGASTLIKTEYAFRTSTFFKGLSTNVYYRFLVQGVAAPGYCPPFAYTSTLGFGITTLPFSPSSLTGLQLWLDAGDTATVTLSGSNVTGWADKSGTSKTLAISATKPYRVINAQNSMNSIYFTAASQTYVSTTLSSAVGTGDVNMFAVWKALGSNTTAVTGLGGLNGVGGTMGMGWHASGKYLVYDYGVNETTFTSSNGAWVVEVGQRQNGVLQTTVNGSTSATVSGATSYTNTSLVVGSGPGFYGNGEVGEAMIYTGFITPYDRQKVEGYLSWKWGLQTNLVASHPFKLAAPTSASVFSPSTFSSLSIWLDGSDPLGTGTPPANGTSITTWANKSGAGSNAISAGTAPTYLSASNAVSFGGSGYYTTGYSASLSSETTFVVFNVSVGSILLGASGNGGRNFTATSSNVSADIFNVGGANTYTTSNSVAFNNTYIGELVTTNQNMTTYVNGGSNAVSATRSATGGLTSLIGRALDNGTTPVGTLQGRIFEVLAYNRALSTDDRQTVEGYLAWKWGLQGNLPTTHPYKFLSPASNYAGAVIPQGLLVNFTATAYSGSGTWSNTASLGTNNDATVENGTPSKNGAGNGVVFNGATNFTFSNVAVGNAWTASLWLKRTGSNDAGACYLTQLLSGSILNLGIYTNFTLTGATAGSNDIAGGFFNSTWRTTTALTTTTNTWYNMTYTWNGTTLIMYVAGSSNAAATPGISASDGGTAYRIGRRWDSASYIRGEIGQILIYNRALTAAEVAQNYAATSTVYTV